jgi:hypothetical protein
MNIESIIDLENALKTRNVLKKYKADTKLDTKL